MLQNFKIAIKVKLFSSKSIVQKFCDSILEVSLAAKPKDGEANKELCRVLSDFFVVPKSSIIIESGHTSRNKIISILEISSEEAIRRLDAIHQEEEKT